MNKKFVALAVSAIAAGAASAQTANVTLYGIIDSYLASERGSSATVATNKVSTTALVSGGISGSRWGLRGSEDLGGGLNAFFNLENGFNVDTGSLGQGGLVFGRRAFVGVNGGFGSIQVGRDYSPNFFVQCNSDDSFGGCLNGWSAVANMGGFFANTLRQNNQVKYSTPNMGGLTSTIAWSMGEVAGTSSGSRTLGGNVEYKNGPIYVGVGFSDQKNAAATASDKQFILGGTYNFGVAYVGATYMENKTAAGVKTKPLVASVTVPFGAARVGLQLAQAKRDGGDKQSSFGLLGEYDLSKRTELYGVYTQCKNDGLVCAADGNVATSTASAKGMTASLLGLGIKHKF
jgi:predicted porin